MNSASVLHVSPSYYPAMVYGGPTLSLKNLCEQLSTKIDAIHVITTTANGNSELDVVIGQPINVNGVCVTYYPRLTKGNTHFSPALLKGLIQKLNGFDIVHVHAWWNLVSVLSVVLATARRKKIIVSPRGTLSAYSIRNRARKLFISFCKKFLFKKVFFHVTTEKEKSEILHIIGEHNANRVFIIPNIIEGIKPPDFTSAKPNDGVLSFLFIGRINEVKNLEDTFKALSSIREPWKLRLMGGCINPAYQLRLKEFADNLQITDKIEWLGEVYDEIVKSKYLQSADFLLLLSHTENFGNVVIEALQHGLPVIVSRYVGAAELVKKWGLGWVALDGHDAITRTILSAAADKAKTAFIRSNAASILLANYNSNMLVEQYLNTYLTVKNA